MRKILIPVLMMTKLLTGCIGHTPQPGEPTEPVEPSKDSCTFVKETQKLQFHESDGTRGTYDQEMPVTKAIAHEGHYLVDGLDPAKVSKVNEQIVPHMARTCSRLLRGDWAKYYPGLSAGCTEVYKGAGATEWTPAEPTVGRGSGPLYPSVECEAATANMYWANGAGPKKGARYIVKNPANGRAFVLCMGYEAGPGSKSKSGGISTEALYYLKGGHGLVVTLGKALNQDLPYGPLECVK